MANFAQFPPFQSFPTKVAQDNSEWPISPNWQLFQSFPTEVAQNDLKWPILPDSQLLQSFPPKWLRMTQNGQFCIAKRKKHKGISMKDYTSTWTAVP